MKKIVLLTLSLALLMGISGCQKKTDYASYYKGFLESYDYSSINSVTYAGFDCEYTKALYGDTYADIMVVNHKADPNDAIDSEYISSLIGLKKESAVFFLYTEADQQFIFEGKNEEEFEPIVIFEPIVNDTTRVTYQGAEVINSVTYDILEAQTIFENEAKPGEDEEPTIAIVTTYSTSFSYAGLDYTRVDVEVIEDKVTGYSVYDEFENMEFLNHAWNFDLENKKAIDIESGETIDITINDCKTEEVIHYPYLEYQVTLTWIDGNEYSFELTRDTAGDIYIDGQYPEQLAAEESTWEFDLKECIITNTATGETVSFEKEEIGNEPETYIVTDKVYVDRAKKAIYCIVENASNREKPLQMYINAYPTMPEIVVADNAIEISFDVLTTAITNIGFYVYFNTGLY